MLKIFVTILLTFNLLSSPVLQAELIEEVKSNYSSTELVGKTKHEQNNERNYEIEPKGNIPKDVWDD